MKMKKLFFAGILVLISIIPAAAQVRPVQEKLSKEEVARLRLIPEAYLKMQQHYYAEIPENRFEQLFYQVEVMAAQIIKDTGGTVDEKLDTLIYGTLEWMVYKLRDKNDTISRFIHKSQLRPVVRENLASRFAGIGIEVEERNGGFFIRTVYANSSAAKEGVLVGDKLLAVNHEDIAALDFSALEKRLTIPSGDTVLLTLLHPGGTTAVDVLLTCTIIVVPSVVSEYYAKERVGYVRIKEFRNETGREVRDHIAAIAHPDMRGLILDLRDNDGGNMEQAVAVCDLFLPPKVLVCYFLKRDVGRRDEYTSNPMLKDAGLRNLIILVNNKTGSAAEIVAGALKEYKRARLVGTKTKGTGALKNTIGLSDGSVLYLITSRTYLPNNTTFNEIGIQPDTEEADTKKQLEYALRTLAEGTITYS